MLLKYSTTEPYSHVVLLCSNFDPVVVFLNNLTDSFHNLHMLVLYVSNCFLQCICLDPSVCIYTCVTLCAPCQ